MSKYWFDIEDDAGQLALVMAIIGDEEIKICDMVNIEVLSDGYGIVNSISSMGTENMKVSEFPVAKDVVNRIMDTFGSTLKLG